MVVSERFPEGYLSMAAFCAGEQRDITEDQGVTVIECISSYGYNEDGSLAANVVYSKE